MEGTKNAYTCNECGGRIITVESAPGATPMFINCRSGKRGCVGIMTSHLYDSVPDQPPTHEWYKPSAQEYESLPPGMREHVKHGGLLLRPLHAA